MTNWERAYLGTIAVILIITQAGCGVMRAGYHACREGLCR